MPTLKPAPYSKEGLTDGNFTHINRYKIQEWIVTYRGEHMGSVKLRASGWTFSPAYATGQQLSSLEYAIELLKEYLAENTVK